MLLRIIAGTFLLGVCGAAFGQDLSVPGYDPDWNPPGMYAAPFVPRVTTPSIYPDAAPTPLISLSQVTLTTGASNATAGNVAGAENATLSIPAAGTGTVFAQPVWYGPAAWPMIVVEAVSEPRGEVGFEFGAAASQMSYGAAQLMVRPTKHAPRVYTNQDVVRGQ